METVDSGGDAHIILQDSYVYPPDSSLDQALNRRFGSAAEKYREDLGKEQCKESRSLVSDLKRLNLKVEYIERSRSEPHNSLGFDPLLTAMASLIIFSIPFFTQLQKNAADDVYPKIKDWLRKKLNKNDDGNTKTDGDSEIAELYVYGNGSSMTVFRPTYTRKVWVVAELDETKTVALLVKAEAPAAQALGAFDSFYSFVQSYHQKTATEEFIPSDRDDCVLVEFDPQLKKLVVKDNDVLKDGELIETTVDRLEETIQKMFDEK